MEPAELRRRCAKEIQDCYGYFDGEPWLRTAFEAVPREDFVPDLVWWPRQTEDGLYPLLDRAQRPRQWLEAVYRPLAALITQIADGAVRPEKGPTNNGDFTSSISCPAVVVQMLRHLALEPGERVLEIGTGTGYNTALLAQRAARVVSVEIDRGLAAHAVERLGHVVGCAVEVHAEDGEQGWQPGAPYDRIISTAAVRHIPRAWLDQVKPGGVILTPIDTPMGCDALLRLDHCDGRGSARGHLVSGVTFMKLRSQRERGPWHTYGWPRFPDWEFTVSPQNGQRARTRPGS